MTTAFSCVLCGEGWGVPRWGSGPWEVVACGRCGLLRTWPPPAAGILNEIYEGAAYHAARSVGWSTAADWRGRARSVLDSVPSRPTSVLDFGAGPGHLVRALREEGIAAEGVEPYGAPRAQARRDHGIELAPGILADWTQSFDVATLFHSLEHVRDPVRTLVDLRTVLRPGGWILVEVPHAGATEMWRPGTRRVVMDLPLHLHHFTPKTLSSVVERAGFAVTRVDLFNCSEIERVLALRRRPAQSATNPRPGAGIGRSPSGGRALDSAASCRRALRAVVARPAAEALLAGLRLAAPGYKFCVLAKLLS